MENQSQSKKIYYRQTKEWIEVSDEYYNFHNKERDLFRDRMRKRGECGCPCDERWLCDTDCLTCEFKKSGKWQSWETTTNENKHTAVGEFLPSNYQNVEEFIMDGILLEKLIKTLNQLDINSSKICSYVMEGKSEREIAKLLNLSRSTYKRRWDKVKEKLSIKLKDFL